MSHNIRIVPALLSAAIVALAFGVVTVARADTSDTPAQQRVVSFKDLNLDRPADAAKLYYRIQRAADLVCHSEIGPFAQAQNVMRQCTNKSVAEAVASISHPNLTALYAGRITPGVPVTAKR